MKKQLIFFPAILVAVATVTVSCDYVAVPGETTVIDTTPTVAQRKILLEDYTGHVCMNCPDAADSLHSIMTKYPGRIIPIAIHCGVFAQTRNEPLTPIPFCANANPNAFLTDHRSVIGTDWDNFFDVSAPGLPQGMVNRSGYTSSQHIIDRTVWKDSVYAMLQQPADAQLTITPDYNIQSRVLNVTVKTKFLNALNSSQGYALSVVITEDGIVDWQNVHGSCDPAYHFEHTLRTGIGSNATQGTILTTGNVSAGQEFVQNYTNVSISNNWVDDNCHIVAFVYDVTNWKVVQAEMIELKQ